MARRPWQSIKRARRPGKVTKVARRPGLEYRIIKKTWPKNGKKTLVRVLIWQEDLGKSIYMARRPVQDYGDGKIPGKEKKDGKKTMAKVQRCQEDLG